MFAFDIYGNIIYIEKEKNTIEQTKEYMKKKYSILIQNKELYTKTIDSKKSQILEYM